MRITLSRAERVALAQQPTLTAAQARAIMRADGVDATYDPQGGVLHWYPEGEQRVTQPVVQPIWTRVGIPRSTYYWRTNPKVLARQLSRVVGQIARIQQALEWLADEADPSTPAEQEEGGE